jgi:hypothetical protein
MFWTVDFNSITHLILDKDASPEITPVFIGKACPHCKFENQSDRPTAWSYRRNRHVFRLGMPKVRVFKV